MSATPATFAHCWYCGSPWRYHRIVPAGSQHARVLALMEREQGRDQVMREHP